MIFCDNFFCDKFLWLSFVTNCSDEFLWQTFVTKWDELLRRFFFWIFLLTYIFLTNASFRIGVPSILFLSNSNTYEALSFIFRLFCFICWPAPSIDDCLHLYISGNWVRALMKLSPYKYKVHTVLSQKAKKLAKIVDTSVGSVRLSCKVLDLFSAGGGHTVLKSILHCHLGLF